jgi:hypothetical protein
MEKHEHVTFEKKINKNIYKCQAYINYTLPLQHHSFNRYFRQKGCTRPKENE